MVASEFKLWFDEFGFIFEVVVAMFELDNGGIDIELLLAVAADLYIGVN